MADKGDGPRVPRRGFFRAGLQKLAKAAADAVEESLDPVRHDFTDGGRRWSSRCRLRVMGRRHRVATCPVTSITRVVRRGRSRGSASSTSARSVATASRPVRPGRFAAPTSTIRVLAIRSSSPTSLRARSARIPCPASPHAGPGRSSRHHVQDSL